MPKSTSWIATASAIANSHRSREFIVNETAGQVAPVPVARVADRNDLPSMRAGLARRGARTGALVEMQSLIRAIPDFPIPGILFRDITPLLRDRDGFRTVIDTFVGHYRDARIDHVVGIEARGYMIGAPVAYALHAGFVPVRKPGKLPSTTYTEEYALEYGTNTLQIHDDAVGRGERVLVIDDLLATGGTAAATRRLLERLGAEIVGFGFLIELAALEGRKALPGIEVSSFISF